MMGYMLCKQEATTQGLRLLLPSRERETGETDLNPISALLS
jgi:hypothetical protein